MTANIVALILPVNYGDHDHDVDASYVEVLALWTRVASSKAEAAGALCFQAVSISLLEPAATEAEAQGTEVSRPHPTPARAKPLPAQRESAALDHKAAGRVSLPAGGSLQLAYGAQQLALVLGYRDAASVYDLARRDGTFPKPVQLAPGSERRYLASDVHRWLEQKRGVA